MKIAIASDHGGYIVKKEIINELVEKGIAVEDLGTNSMENTDYVDFGIKLGEYVTQNNDTLGIGICKTGNGFCLICNKIKGIRCIKVDSLTDAIEAIEKHNANILAFSGIKGSNFIIESIDQFMNSKFSGEERYIRRINKIKEYEEKDAA